jgi:cobalamin biosynthesis protein CobT
MATAQGQSGYLARPQPSGLAEVIDIILDKGLVIDAYVRVSLVGIEILTIDARIVIASVDTYLRFAEAVNRLDLEAKDDSKGLPELMDDMSSGAGKSSAKGAIEGVKEKVTGGDDDDDDDEDTKEKQPRRRSRSSASGSGSRRSSSSRSRKKDDS